MKTIYTTKVKIANAPFSLERTFRFATIEESEKFRASIDPGGPVHIAGYNIDHLFTPEEALEEIGNIVADEGFPILMPPLRPSMGD